MYCSSLKSELLFILLKCSKADNISRIRRDQKQEMDFFRASGDLFFGLQNDQALSQIFF